MIEKCELIKGTKEELLEYFSFVKDEKSFNVGAYFSSSKKMTIKKQLNYLIKNKKFLSCIFYMTIISNEIKNNVPDVAMTLKHEYIYIVDRKALKMMDKLVKYTKKEK
jgi:hypothetical protein